MIKVGEFRQMSFDDLTQKVDQLSKNLLLLRCNKTVSQLEDTSVLRNGRKELARALTVLNEKKKAESNG